MSDGCLREIKGVWRVQRRCLRSFKICLEPKYFWTLYFWSPKFLDPNFLDYRFHPRFAGPNIFWTQNFFGPKYFGTIIYFLLGPGNCWIQNFSTKHFLTQNYFGFIIFLTKKNLSKFLDPIPFLAYNFFFTKNFLFWTKTYLDQKLYLTHFWDKFSQFYHYTPPL